MHEIFHQASDHPLICLAGYVICPVLTTVPLLAAGMQYNYTEVLNSSWKPLFLFCNLPAACFLAWLLVHAKPLNRTAKTWHLQILALALVSALVILVPYHDAGSVLSNLHVMFACIDFILCTLIVLQSVFFRPVLRTVFLCGLVLVFLLVAAAMRISGPAELAYAFLLLFTLTSAVSYG